VSASASPYLSIIIPAHNEESRLIPGLESIRAFLDTQTYDAEVLVVENGSRDRTAEIAQEYAEAHPFVRVMRVDTRGKGLAVKAGMLAARGEWRFSCDADLSMPIEELPRFLPPKNEGAPIIIASREGEGSQRVNEPPYRHFMGRINNTLIKLLALPGFEDTQCGFKMFRAAEAEDLFGVQLMSGIGFDVEILYVADKRGYAVKEVPITWYFDPYSTMRLFEDSLNMVREIWQIRRNWHNGMYLRDGQATSHSQPEA
jgi:dolichyl-phosphate beta-glucosyltransferase